MLPYSTTMLCIAQKVPTVKCGVAASKTFQVEIFREQYDEIRKWRRLLDHPWGMQEIPDCKG